jgi:hypothetical protein
MGLFILSGPGDWRKWTGPINPTRPRKTAELPKGIADATDDGANWTDTTHHAAAAVMTSESSESNRPEAGGEP